MQVGNLKIGDKYKWKHEDYTLIFMGVSGCWCLFNLEETGKLWCEVLDSDLHLMEKVIE